MKKLCVFAKNPRLGKVKTRLMHAIGAQAALEVYQDLLGYTINVVSNLNSEIHVNFYFSENVDASIWSSGKVQVTGDIGEKMYKCFVEEFENNSAKVVIIGSDSFEIKKSHIEQAFEYLKTNDVVLGPAVDGGYYLIGMTQLWPEIFQDVDWGTSSVLAQTLSKCKVLSLSTCLLETISDVDIVKDLPPEYLLDKKFDL